MVNISKPFLDYKYKSLTESLAEPHSHQEAILKEVTKVFSDTQYASDLGFSREVSTQAYLKSMPLCRYDDLSPYISSMKLGQKNLLLKDKVRYYGESSGTTGRNKHIPLSKKYVRECLIKGSMYSAAIVNHHVRDATEGKMVVLPGSLRQIGDNQIGDVSAIMAEHIPLLLRHKSAINTGHTLNGSWETKVSAVIDAAETGNIMGLSGLPTWNLKLLEHYIATHSEEKVQSFINNISYFVHGGISLAPYRQRFNQIFQDRDILYINVYNATEGFFGFQLDPSDGEDITLFIDGHVYYEFVRLQDIEKEEPPIVPLKEVLKGTPYVMLISNTSGLYRYVMEDVIAFANTAPYKIRILGRTSGFLNAFGEEVMEGTCNQVIDQLTQLTGVEINDFTVAPRFIQHPEQTFMGCHEWLIEFNAAVNYNEEQLAEIIDKELKKLSHDYAEKRKNDYIMCTPIVRVLQSGCFQKYLNQQRKVSVQSKIPRISTNRQLVDDIYALI